ncbi:uncharacterized protein IAS62_003222 [Cryptococcus decagattii]|uniref:Cytoplasmic protein n=1 Tax=Cryptococcus decagattii TaxID=1859122 RepID=A0ABZ2AWU3_9TREE
MAKPIQNSKPHHSLPNSHVSPDLITPVGTPPSGAENSYDTAMESRLHQFMSSFDAGTHSFDREERESPEERRMSFGSSDALPTPPSSRRPSFLSSLGIRPFTFVSSSPSTSSATLSGFQPKDAFGNAMNLGMMPISGPDGGDPSSTQNRPHLGRDMKSTPNLHNSLFHHSDNVERMDQALSGHLPNGAMVRSKTTSQINKQSGFILGSAVNKSESPTLEHDSASRQVEREEEKRHFDPSKDPRLLGLL